MSNEVFKDLPSVDKVISDNKFKRLLVNYPRALVTNVIRNNIERERGKIKGGFPISSYDVLIGRIVDEVNSFAKPSLTHVINATGVILHTNLGRAPISREATATMSKISNGYSNLEFDLESGMRGSRHVHVENILCELTGAESAMVVNNNAAAVLLTLTSLAKRREVIVSRGESVEIGGGFRVPDIMRQSGTKLIEVGTTNCTYIHDYEQAINQRTAALLKVHRSNFRVEGFTQSVEIYDIVKIANNFDIPAIYDQGSGCFIDTAKFGLSHEPTVQEGIEAGIDIVCFSGDKLVGGPQAGLIVGKKKHIDKLKHHPLARAIRMDKTRLSGLWSTLLCYLKGEAINQIPIWKMISSNISEIQERASTWVNAIPSYAQIIDGVSMVGGGSLPGDTLPTKLVAVKVTGRHRNIITINTISENLRKYNPPIVGRIEEGVLLLDPRTVSVDEDKIVINALREILVK